jgi:hypothetical protein
MFNEFQKRRYLDGEYFRFEESTKEVAERLFETVSETENQKNLDLAEFTKLQVVELLKNINSRSKNYLRLVAKNCFEYSNWCRVEGFVDKSIPNSYDYSIVKNIIDDLIPLRLLEDKHFLREDIKKYLDVIYDPLLKFVLYASFCGVYGNEGENLSYLKFSDINQEEKTVKLKDGKLVNIDDLFIQLAFALDSATEAYQVGENNSRKPNQYVYDQSVYILKTCGRMTVDAPVTRTFIMAKFRDIQKLLNNKFINGGNLYKNGLINYIYEKFKEQNITLKQALFEKKDKRNYTYSKELQQYINEFGSGMTDRMLRLQMQDIIDLFN